MPVTINALLPEYKTTCGGTIKDPSKYPSVEYRDGTIYFCTRACLQAFKENPDAFIAGKVEHPTEND